VRENEAATLHKLVHVIRPVTPIAPSRNPYETLVQAEETQPGNVSYTISDLPEKEGQYNVITFKGSNAKLHDFFDASVLICTRLELGTRVFSTPVLGGPGFRCGSW